MIESLIAFAIAVVVVGLIVGFLIFMIRRAPFIPGEMKAIAEWILIVVGVLAIIYQALPLIRGIA